MRAALVALPAFEVAVRGRGATLARRKLVWVHGETHRAARLAPVESGGLENLVESFGFRLLFHQAGAGNDHRVDVAVDLFVFGDTRDLAQIFDAPVGAGTDEYTIELDIRDLLAAAQTHVAERTLGRDALVLIGDFGQHRHAAGDGYNLLGAGAPTDDRRKLRRVEPDLTVEMRGIVGTQRFPIPHRIVPGLALGRFRLALEVIERHVVGRDEAGLGTAFHRHVADGHAAFHRDGADRIAGIFERIARAAGGADLADDGEDDVLCGDVGRQFAVDDRAHVFRFFLDQRLRGEHVFDFRRADAVGERAEGAVRRGVAVAAHDRRAGQCETLLGADDVANALALIELVEIFDAEVFGVLRHHRDLLGAFRIGIWFAAIRRRHVVIDDGERFFRRVYPAARVAQAFERLRTRHLMYEMAIDINEAGTVRLFVDQMVVPDLVVERTRLGHR